MDSVNFFSMQQKTCHFVMGALFGFLGSYVAVAGASLSIKISLDVACIQEAAEEMKAQSTSLAYVLICSTKKKHHTCRSRAVRLI